MNGKAMARFLCSSGGAGDVLSATLMLLAGAFTVFASVRILAYALDHVDPRWPLPRAQRLLAGVLGLATGLVLTGGCAYFLIVRPVC